MKSYYEPDDLQKFSTITRVNKPLGDKYFSYYNA